LIEYTLNLRIRPVVDNVVTLKTRCSRLFFIIFGRKSYT